MSTQVRPPQDVQQMMRYDANKKSIGVSYVLWFFLGFFGVHRFYLSRGGSAVAMLLTGLLAVFLSFVGIGLLIIPFVVLWELVDAFLIPGWVQESNNRLISGLTD